MQKIVTFLTYNDQAEAAAELYTSIFANSRILHKMQAGPGGPVFSVTFELEGQPYYALNGGPHFKFSEGISLFVNCSTQEEVDRLWNLLIADGGEPGRCGWLKDKFGVSWQVIPDQLGRLMGDPDPEKSQRVMQAMLQMGKIVIADLERAHAG